MLRRTARERRGSGAINWLPTMVDPTNLVLWLRADQGVTLSSASIANPNDFGTGWTANGVVVSVNTAETLDPVGGNTADKIREDNSVGANHRIFEAPTNDQPGPQMLVVSAKMGTTNGCRYILVGGSSVSGSVFDLQAGTVFADIGAGCVGQIVSLGNGWYDCYCRIVPLAPFTLSNYQVFMSHDGSTFSYNGDNLSNIYLYNARLIQDRVSAWADQSGLGNNGTQGTAASQMFFQELDASGLWIPTGQGGSPRIGNPTDAEKSVGYTNAVYDPFTGNGNPGTVLVVGLRAASPAASTFGPFRLAGATARRDVMQQNFSTLNFTAAHTDDATASKAWNSSTAAKTTLMSMVSVCSPTTESLYGDGVIDAASPRDIDLGVQTWTSAITGARARVYKEIVVYKSALSNDDRRKVENGMRARWGLPTL